MVSSLDNRLLFGPESQGIGGGLRRAATAALVNEVIKLRGLPFHEYFIETGPYNQPHLLMMSNDQRVAFSINQVKEYEKFPRPAKYREPLININTASAPELQPAFDLFNEEHKDVPPDGWTYVMLTHGYGSSKPRFIGLGIPKKRNKWIDIKNILEDVSAEMMVPQEMIEQIVKPALKKGIITERSQEV